MNPFKSLLGIFNKPRSGLPQGDARTVQVPLIGAGMHVDHDRALTYSAVFAATRLISETIATLPWHVLMRNPDGTRERLPTSPVESVLNRSPNPEMTPMAFRSILVAHALTWGNGYAEIVRDNAGRVKELWPIGPDLVEPKRDPDTGEKFYRVHLFANGAMPNAALKHPMRLSDEAHQRLQAEVKEKSGTRNAGKTWILEEGMDLMSIGIPPEDAQFLETRKFQITEVARWFRVPPHKLADLERATFSNIESQSREFVGDSLMPWIVRLEQEVDRKLLGRGRGSRPYSKIVVNGLLRGDSQARAAYYQTMANLGVFSVNDIRELEDIDPIGPEGDKRLVQLNQTTLEKIGEEPEMPEEPETETETEIENDGLPDTEQGE